MTSLEGISDAGPIRHTAEVFATTPESTLACDVGHHMTKQVANVTDFLRAREPKQPLALF
jgi:hypothetical protein